MNITKIVVNNYKSFFEETEIEFSPGFNVIIGKNNSGKTALVELLSTNFENIPHQSLATSPKIGMSNLNPNSTAKVVYEVNRDDHRTILSNRTTTIMVPETKSGDANHAIEKIKSALGGVKISVQASYRNNNLEAAYLSVTGNVDSDYAWVFDQFDYTYNNRSRYVKKHDIAHILTQQFQNRVYSFRAERFLVGQSAIGPNTRLIPDASNLPEVLRNLKSGKSHVFSKYLRHFQIVFPEIKDINVNPTNDGKYKIFLSSIDPEEERYDLDIPLQDSGTGLGQVLAILYVVVTSQFPQVIIIDEPQSFLHPGAVRKLFNILKQSFSQHQYIVTTHSPTVISSINPSNIIQLVLEESITKPRHIDINQNSEMRQILSDVGASLSDVFGADNVLWVEGSTEENCFQEIIPAKCNNNLLGTAIASVLHTGDFESKKKKAVETAVRIYKRLSESTALIPPAIGFIFDREGRSEEEILELKKLGNIHFLKRRMYENYLLNSEIITEYISSLSDFSDEGITTEEINSWFEQNKWDPKYYTNPIPEDNRNDNTWLNEVHGAAFLHDLFMTLSETRYSYEDNKVHFGLDLTRRLLATKSEDLDEIAELIDKVIGDK